MKNATINEFGDVACPECHTNIIKPPGADYMQGEGACPACKKWFYLAQGTIDNFKEIAE